MVYLLTADTDGDGIEEDVSLVSSDPDPASEAPKQLVIKKEGAVVFQAEPVVASFQTGLDEAAAASGDKICGLYLEGGRGGGYPEIRVILAPRSDNSWSFQYDGRGYKMAPLHSQEPSQEVPPGGASGVQNTPFPVVTVEGTLAGLELGNDSCQIELVVEGGQNLTFRSLSSLDGLPPDQREELSHTIDALPGKSWPTLADRNSRIRLYYLAAQPRRFLKYQVLSAPGPLWFVIIASASDASQAHQTKQKAYAKGFFPDVITSDDYPSLRPGYSMVVVGAFSDQAEAQACARRAQAAGWPDAYARRAR